MRLYAVATILITSLLCSLLFISDFEPVYIIAADPIELWHYNLDSNSYGGAAVGDIDSDGKFEVVFGTYMGDEYLYALNAEDGSLLWRVWAGPGPLDASVKLVDVTGDNRLEIIFATSGSYGSGAGVMHCLHGINGSAIWHYDPDTCTDSPPAIADIDNDGKLEILYGTFHDGIDGGYVHILNAEDGSLVDTVGPFNGHIQSGPSVTDLDMDGQLDFVVAMYGGDHRVYAVNGSDYSTMWYFQTGESMYHGCSFANLDDDDYPELVIGNYDGTVYAIHGENGTKFWEYNGISAYYNTVIADVDNDDSYEIIASGSFAVLALNNDGTFLWDASSGSSFRGAAVADLDGDNDLDVVVGDSDGLLQGLEGDTGNDIWSFDAETDYGISPFDIDNGPVVADLNCDGHLDVFFVGGRGYSGDPENNYGRAYALTIGATGEEGWSMFRHDYCNSGCFNQTHPGTLRGYVTDSDSGLSVYDTEILLGSISTGSNTSGIYCINILSGTYKLSLTKDGYETYAQQVEIIGGQITNLNVSMTVERSTTTSTSTTSSSTTITTSGDIPIDIPLTIILVSSTFTAVILVVFIRYRRKS
ncbi:MAG: PQQ-binding-like beta-propeller repeat protein [Candidatus Thorarchaeota archaeon]